MFQRCAAITTLGLVVFLSISTAAAGDWTISEGGSYDISAQIEGGANLAAGDAIIIDGATDPNPVTIRIDSGTVPALGKADKPAIWIKAPVTVTIQFVGTNNLRLGHEDGTALRISQDGGALTVDGNGHFDFSANENKVLTLTGIANGGTFLIDNNEIKIEGTLGGAITGIRLGGNSAKFTSTVSVTVANIDLIGNAIFSIDNEKTLTTALALNGNAASLVERGTISNVSMNLNGSTIAVPANAQSPAKIGTLGMQANEPIKGTINVANGKELTTTDPISVGHHTLTLSGAGTVSSIYLDDSSDDSSGYLSVLASGTITSLVITTDARIDLGANLTVTDPLNIGANTLVLQGNGKLNQVVFNDDMSKLMVDDSPTITTVNIIAVNSEIFVDSGKTLTVINGVSIPTDKTLTLSGPGTVSDIRQINENTTLKVEDDAGVTTLSTGDYDFIIDVATEKSLTLDTPVSVWANTLTLAGSGTISGVWLDHADSILTSSGAAMPIITNLLVSADCKVLLQDGRKITVSNPFSVGANIFTLAGSGGGVQDSFDATIRLTHPSPSSKLLVDGDDADNIKDYTVSVEANGISLEFDSNSSPKAINMMRGRGSLDLTVAVSKILNTVVYVSQNTLSLRGQGKVNTIVLGENGGQIDLYTDAIVEKIRHAARSLIRFRQDGRDLTITDAIEVGGNTLEINGSGGGGSESVLGTFRLQSPGSILKFTGEDEDNIGGYTIVVDAKGATVNTEINIDPVAINMTADSGDLNLRIADTKRIEAPVAVNNNTLTLWDKGAVASIKMNRNGGALTVRESVTVDDITVDGNVGVNVFPQKTLTTDLNIQTHELTLTGTGTISHVLGTTGMITANTAATIGELTAIPGANQTFTWSGTGSSTVTRP